MTSREKITRINRAFARQFARDRRAFPDGVWFPTREELRAAAAERRREEAARHQAEQREAKREEVAKYQAEYRETQRQARSAATECLTATVPKPKTPPRPPGKPPTRPPAAPAPALPDRRGPRR